MEIILKALSQYWIIVLLIVFVYSLKTRWFKGVIGEFIVNLFLSFLPKEKYNIIKNVTLPTEDGTTQIDHIIVSEFGIFVVETKNMKGWIYGTEKQKQWTQKIFKNSFKFQNPLHQNYKHIKTLETILALPLDVFHSVIVFVGDSTFKNKMPDNVLYGRNCIKYICSFNKTLLKKSEVVKYTNLIDQLKLKRGIVTDYKHRQHVKEIITQKEG